MKKEILIGSIIAVVMFIMFSSSSALDVEIQNKDDDIYLITKISGYPTSGEIVGFGFFRELTITQSPVGIDYIEIQGMKISNGRLDSFHYWDVSYVKAYHFFGIYHEGGPTAINRVFGIAIGEIEWS